MESNQIGYRFGFDFNNMMAAAGGDRAPDFSTVFGSVTEEQFKPINTSFTGVDGAFGNSGKDDSSVTTLGYIDNNLGTYSAIGKALFLVSRLTPTHERTADYLLLFFVPAHTQCYWNQIRSIIDSSNSKLITVMYISIFDFKFDLRLVNTYIYVVIDTTSPIATLFLLAKYAML